MKNYLVSTIFFVISVSLATCQVPRWGRCPDIPVKQNFDADRYLGKWYENEKFFFLAELGLKCISANYSLNNDGSIKVLNAGVNTRTGRPSEAVGRATLGETEPAKLSVKFSRFQPAGAYWVLDTDYDTYSLVWSCSDFYFARTEIAWILTRDRDGVDEATTNRLKNILQTYHVDTTSFRKTDQIGCTKNIGY
ncbi:apolipoprotein D-like isoform X1 [Mytilus californianus]|uniref:apolipoprotein D-like isoform X1 n=1 Tax=Mytilus californianus TaxID=6549 RepID=UPI0022483553|nr:apolipoprotein D-like isoform X1 [Mytilus californianus]